MSETRFEVIETHDVVIDGPPELGRAALLSPFVWREGEAWMLLLRVNLDSDDSSGRIWLGESTDGLTFRMDETPLIEPTLPHLDIGGCEDPTVVRLPERCIVFYTGVDGEGRGEMLWASGPDVRSMEKRGVAFSCSRTELNTKEATVDLNLPGWWRLFHEYAHDGRSCIGLASGREPDGPWTEHRDPITARDDRWDCYHLSTGPLIDGDDGELVMFYNGADRTPKWGIGWATFDRATLQLQERCDAPLIAPPADTDRATPIDFAASALPGEDGTVHLYYSRDDDVPRRATVRRR